MALKAGIVGLPNVGKSTLFNAITKSNILAANYPFATIEPNVGVVEVPDKRLDFLKETYNSKRIIKAVCEFTDIAGLVKGASKGEGLGNMFLSNIRNCDAIIQVIRCFEDDNIIHVEGSVNPIRDANTINLELILSDLEQVVKRIQKIEKKAKAKDKDAIVEYELLKKLEDALVNEKSLRELDLDKDELNLISSYGFLTLKPMMYVCNVKEDDLLDLSNAKLYNEFKEYCIKTNTLAIAISCQIESELSNLDEQDKLEFLKDLGLEESGLDLLIKNAYYLLGYETYFTAGVEEARAWTFKKGSKAPVCAGIIHTDFERGFIKAEVLSYKDLYENKTYQACREKGLVRLEGKEYIVSDGDIIIFKFNV